MSVKSILMSNFSENKVKNQIKPTCSQLSTKLLRRQVSIAGINLGCLRQYELVSQRHDYQERSAEMIPLFNIRATFEGQNKKQNKNTLLHRKRTNRIMISEILCNQKETFFLLNARSSLELWLEMRWRGVLPVAQGSPVSLLVYLIIQTSH